MFSIFEKTHGILEVTQLTPYPEGMVEHWLEIAKGYGQELSDERQKFP